MEGVRGKTGEERRSGREKEEEQDDDDSIHFTDLFTYFILTTVLSH